MTHRDGVGRTNGARKSCFGSRTGNFRKNAGMATSITSVPVTSPITIKPPSCRTPVKVLSINKPNTTAVVAAAQQIAGASSLRSSCEDLPPADSRAITTA